MIRHVTFRQLQVFAEASRQLSFARAAELLHLTQPAVSMQIRQLESALGLALFERVNRRLALTAAGKLFRQHAMRVLGELQDAEQALDALQGLKGGTVAVGLVSTAKYFTPRLLALFNRRHPQVDVRLLVGNREVLVNLLKDNEIDLAVMGRPPDALDALAEPLANNPHVLAGPPGHPFAQAREIDMHELRGETFLMREEGSGTRLVMEAMFAQHLFKPRRMITMGSNETVKQAVMAGMGLSLLSLHTLALELRTDEVGLLGVSGTPVMRTWHVVQMAGKQLSPAARAFRQFLLEETEAYLSANFKLPAHLARRGGGAKKPAKAKPAPARRRATGQE